MTDGIDTRVLAVLLWPSAAMLAAMLAVIAWAGYLTVVAPGDLRGPYIVLLLFQSFAASTGYAQRARRGHFDQLLAGPPSRLRFAVTHALISTAVGAVAWTTISVLDAIGAGGHWPLGFTPKAVAAFVYISALAWAVSVPFSRYSAGVVWLIVTVGLAGSGRLIALRNNYIVASDSWTGLWHAAGPVLLFPPVMAGEPSSPSLALIALVIGAAVVGLAGGVAFIAHYSLALEDLE
jgi:hypothetical protein